MKLYHGSKKIVNKPIFGEGNPHNDYGLGFYMTKDFELAKEWSSGEDFKISYVNEYELDDSKLNILDLDEVDNKVLRWIALLVNYREFAIKFPQSKLAKDYLIENYLIDVGKYDLIRGYRADDCYFMFAKSFLNNQITVEQLGKALLLGDLGDQYVLKSKKSFEKIKFIKSYEVDSQEYYYKRLLRNQIAAKEYINAIDGRKNNELFLSDLMKKANK